MRDKLFVGVQNHYSRDVTKLVDSIREQGYEPKVFTDMTNYYKGADKTQKFKGLTSNFLSMVKAGAESGAGRVLFLQDDVALADDALSKMLYIYDTAPEDTILSWCGFISDSLMKQLEESGAHLRASYWAFVVGWMATPERCRDFIAWTEKHLEDPGRIADDYLLASYLMSKRVVAYEVFPNIVQHIGMYTSILKNGTHSKGQPRLSRLYDKEFDPTTVDWSAEFKRPIRLLRQTHNKMGAEHGLKDYRGLTLRRISDEPDSTK